MNTQEAWPGSGEGFDDDLPGMMRVHIGQRRGQILADHLTRDALRNLARTLGAPTGYRLKSDLATAVAFAGASDPRPVTEASA